LIGIGNIPNGRHRLLECDTTCNGCIVTVIIVYLNTVLYTKGKIDELTGSITGYKHIVFVETVIGIGQVALAGYTACIGATSRTAGTDIQVYRRFGSFHGETLYDGCIITAIFNPDTIIAIRQVVKGSVRIGGNKYVATIIQTISWAGKVGLTLDVGAKSSTGLITDINVVAYSRYRPGGSKTTGNRSIITIVLDLHAIASISKPGKRSGSIGTNQHITAVVQLIGRIGKVSFTRYISTKRVTGEISSSDIGINGWHIRIYPVGNLHGAAGIFDHYCYSAFFTDVKPEIAVG
jgi:hypothetical protein